MAGSQLRECSNSIVRLFEYNTPLVLHTSSKTIGIIFRLLQLAIFLVIFVYYIGYKQSYQLVSYNTIPATRIIRNDASFSLINEIGIPVQDKFNEESRVFYPTTAVMLHQNHSICPEDPLMTLSRCNPGTRDPCPPLSEAINKNGNRTGNCVPVRHGKLRFHPKVTHTCEIEGWCTQLDELHEEVVEKFKLPTLSIMIENEIHFPEFPSIVNINNHNGSTAFCWANGHYYHPFFHPLCPLFKLRAIAEEAARAPGAIPFTYEELVSTGGLISIKLLYDCNFDIRDPTKQCEVDYQFRRLDQFKDKTLGSKHPELQYTVDIPSLSIDQPSQKIRAVIHIYGVHIIAMVAGVGRQFDMFTFLTRLGASAGLFALKPIIPATLSDDEKQNFVDMYYVPVPNLWKSSSVHTFKIQ